MRLLLVEDDAMIGEAVLQVLRTEHYAVDWVRNGAMADAALRSETYDLVLLDLGLPKRDGLEVLRALRTRRASVPVLVATARCCRARSWRKNSTAGRTTQAAGARLNQGIDRAIRGVELLLLAREEAGSEPAGRVDLQQIVQLAVADVLPQARHKRIDLGLAGPASAPGLAAANGQLDALRILLENAVKYTPSGGQVDVSLGQDQGQPVLTVEDSGPGIAPENRPRVFDRFYRVSDTAQESGSGLGLAIVKAIADRHGAVLVLGQSEPLGRLKVEVRFAAATSVVNISVTGAAQASSDSPLAQGGGDEEGDPLLNGLLGELLRRFQQGQGGSATPQEMPTRGQGSGFIVSADGHHPDQCPRRSRRQGSQRQADRPARISRQGAGRGRQDRHRDTQDRGQQAAGRHPGQNQRPQGRRMGAGHRLAVRL